MKNIKNYLIITIIILLGYNFYAFQEQQLQTPEERIIGTWISQENSNTKWIFNNQGRCFWYDGSNLKNTFNYTISSTSPQCGYQVKTGGPEDFYLKLTDVFDNQDDCYEIYGVTDENLSLNYLGTTSNLFFNRQED